MIFVAMLVLDVVLEDAVHFVVSSCWVIEKLVRVYTWLFIIFFPENDPYKSECPDRCAGRKGYPFQHPKKCGVCLSNYAWQLLNQSRRGDFYPNDWAQGLVTPGQCLYGKDYQARTERKDPKTFDDGGIEVEQAKGTVLVKQGPLILEDGHEIYQGQTGFIMERETKQDPAGGPPEMVSLTVKWDAFGMSDVPGLHKITGKSNVNKLLPLMDRFAAAWCNIVRPEGLEVREICEQSGWNTKPPEQRVAGERRNEMKMPDCPDPDGPGSSSSP